MIHSDSWLITIWLDIKWEFQYQFVVYIKIEFIIKLISMKEWTYFSHDDVNSSLMMMMLSKLNNNNNNNHMLSKFLCCLLCLTLLSTQWRIQILGYWRMKSLMAYKRIRIDSSWLLFEWESFPRFMMNISSYD